MPPAIITPNMRVSDILARHPEALPILNKYGINCQDCYAARYETIAQGAQVHSIDLRRLLADLNTAADPRSDGPAPRDFGEGLPLI